MYTTTDQEVWGSNPYGRATLSKISETFTNKRPIPRVLRAVAYRTYQWVCRDFVYLTPNRQKSQTNISNVLWHSCLLFCKVSISK